MPSWKLENTKNVLDRIFKSQLNFLEFADTEHFIEQFTGRAKIDIISFANST